MVDEELRTTAEEIDELRGASRGIETVGFVDSHPRQLLPPLRERVAAPGEILLGFEQRETGGQPVRTGPGPVATHRLSPVGRRTARTFPVEPPPQ